MKLYFWANKKRDLIAGWSPQTLREVSPQMPLTCLVLGPAGCKTKSPNLPNLAQGENYGLWKDIYAMNKDSWISTWTPGLFIAHVVW